MTGGTAANVRSLWFVLAFVLIDRASVSLVYPILPAWIGRVAGVDLAGAAWLAGLVLLATSAAEFLFAPLWGAVSDRYGRRPILLLGMAGFALSYLLQALAPDFTWFLVARILAGVTGATLGAALAYVADVTPPEQRAAQFGRVYAASSLGFILSPLLSGWLVTLDARLPFWCAAAICAAATLVGIAVLDEALPAGRRRAIVPARLNPVAALWHVAVRGRVGWALAMLAVLFFALQAVIAAFPYVAVAKFAWREAEIGYALVLMGGLGVLAQARLVPLVRARVGDAGTVLTGVSTYVVALSTMALAGEGWVFYLGAALYGLASVGAPAMQAILSRGTPPDAQGELQGAVAAINSLTAIAGPPAMLGIFVWAARPDIAFAGAPLLFGAALTAAALLLGAVRLRRVAD